MKTFCIVFFISSLALHDLFAEVRNGYQRDAVQLRIHLQKLQRLLANDEVLTSGERRQIRQDIKAIRSYLLFFELTETLLHRFKSISPELFKQVDELHDQKGNPINTYVKFLSTEAPGQTSLGLASFIPFANDSIACTSEFGTNSATVRIRINNDALEVLAHEFGHLLYIVGNLPTYIVYYRRIYGGDISSTDLGHRGDDPSGAHANLCARQYRLDYAAYVRNTREKELAPLALLASIQRRLHDQSAGARLEQVAVRNPLDVFLPPGPGHWYILP